MPTSQSFINGHPVTPVDLEEETRLSNAELQEALAVAGQAKRIVEERKALEGQAAEFDALAKEAARRQAISQANLWYSEQAAQLKSEVPALLQEAAALRAERARLGPEVTAWLEHERNYHARVFAHYRRSEQASNQRSAAGQPNDAPLLIDTISEWLALLGVSDDALKTIRYNDKDLLSELAQERLKRTFFTGAASLRGMMSNVYRNFLQFAKPMEDKR